jgi:Rho-binding antiterminator
MMADRIRVRKCHVDCFPMQTVPALAGAGLPLNPRPVVAPPVIRAWRNGIAAIYLYRMKRPYQPISCSFYDRLEEAATLRRVVGLRYRAAGQDLEVRGTIRDLYIRDGAEWLEMTDGKAIRLDDLLALDEHRVPPGTSC